jgi:hypothetical protein
MDYIDRLLSLTSVKQRHPVLEKNSTFVLGYIHNNFSKIFYFTNCWTDFKKNTMKERDLDFDQNMKTLSIY